MKGQGILLNFELIQTKISEKKVGKKFGQKTEEMELNFSECLVL